MGLALVGGGTLSDSVRKGMLLHACESRYEMIPSSLVVLVCEKAGILVSERAKAVFSNDDILLDETLTAGVD
eukprot:CAMPEP_0198735242 /NCGR_PEP_ID=MMETSP1475-20131203/58136_1 /TAXON_ID= ORGANISM="Unidentified sp., Strain CCMP1999" /NCGR_SAMPLE_ID=MMETSP1475 /ASSEMBLY_ACC=CAM_ASM_001111 /LENGTH=71 /DNA_ID=CAMNT_0044498861 /DNA_START=59 /DNA_END=274 /DNA_ORIENTATION=-